jgi:hypothetical protein
MMENPVSPDDTYVWTELHYFKARIAIEKNDFDAAASAFAAIREAPRTYSPRRRARSLAIRLHISLNENREESEIRAIASELEIDHLKVRNLDAQDFEAYALYLALCSLGEIAKAHDLIRDYANIHRRSRWPLPRQISRAMSTLTTVPPREEKEDSFCEHTIDPYLKLARPLYR